MSRSRARNTSESASLFPFLAVLLCTLGVLVLLLMAMASVQMDGARKRQSQLEAVPATDSDETEATYKAKQQELAGAQLVRDRQRDTLQRAAAKMSRIERSIRDQQDRLEQLRTAIAELQALDAEHSSDLEQAKERFKILVERIAEKEEELERLRKSESLSPPSYAIVPYDGPNGTRRKPIYIECLKDRVVIQPERIELFPADFHPQLGQGNPLAAALRAATEFLNESNLREKEPPYPLILVRPDGIGSYAAVMGALSRWDSEYGYEMVPGEWVLECGISNPKLASDMLLAVENARSSAAMKAARAPAAFRGSIDSFEVGPGVLDMIQASSPLGGGHASVNNLHTFSAGSADGNNAGIMIDTTRLASALNQRGNADFADPTGGNAASPMSGPSGSEMAGQLEAVNPITQSNVATSNPLLSGAGSGQAEQGEHAGTVSEASLQEGTAVAGAAQSSASSPAAGSASSGSGDSSPSAGLEAPTSDTQVAQTQQPTATITSQTGSLDAQNETQVVGAEGPPGTKAKGAGIGLERPIRVVVGRDRIVIGPRSSAHAIRGESYDGGRTVLLDSDPQQTSNRFSKALQEHIGEWGMAGRDSYWRPVLILQVEAGGERLAADMASALRDSGVDVQLPDTTRR